MSTGRNQKGAETPEESSRRNTASERPWIPVTAQMPDHVMALAGIPAKTFYWDARTFVDAMAKVTAYYDMDGLMPAADVYNFEIEAMGGKMVYSDNAMPTIDHRVPIIKEPEDLLKLHTPDFYRDGRLSYALDCIKLSAEFGGWQCGIFCAPFSMAAGLRSYPLLIKDMRKRPQFTHDLFNFIIDDVLIPFLRVQKDYCGVSIAVSADAWSAIPNLSVRELREWVEPYNRRLIAKAKKLGVTALCVSGQYVEERPEKFDVGLLHAGFDLQVADQSSTPSISVHMGPWDDFPLECIRAYTEKYREQGIETAVRVGINPKLLRDGPADKIASTVKRVINTFARDHEIGVFLSNVPSDTPPKHVHTAVAAAHTYGRLPIADNLDKVEFKPFKRESFQEWKAKVARDDPGRTKGDPA